jgi:Ornithine cyclodeaminase/mu-crystallin family
MQPAAWCGLVFLLSTRNGEPLALINDGPIQPVRLGAGAGFGVKELSRKDAGVVGMLGSGGMRALFSQTRTTANCAEATCGRPTPSAPAGIARRLPVNGEKTRHQFHVASLTMTGSRIATNSVGKMHTIIGTASFAGRLYAFSSARDNRLWRMSSE